MNYFKGVNGDVHTSQAPWLVWRQQLTADATVQNVVTEYSVHHTFVPDM